MVEMEVMAMEAMAVQQLVLRRAEKGVLVVLAAKAAMVVKLLALVASAAEAVRVLVAAQAALAV